jgi:plastocyanin
MTQKQIQMLILGGVVWAAVLGLALIAACVPTTASTRTSGAPSNVATVAPAGQSAAAAKPATGPAAPVQPITAPQPGGPVPVAVIAAPQPASGFAAPSAGPNLLAKNWQDRLGVVVSSMQPAVGQPILNPKPGDVYFFSNASTTWGATNTRNSVWVIDARTKQTVAEVAPAGAEGYSSHGIAVSGDGKYIYLPALGKQNHIDVLDGRTFEVVQTITTLGRPHHQKLWRDPVSDRDLIIGEDFNWNWSGSGFYVLDPSQDNAVVGGMSNGDFQGNPYYSTPAPDGSFIVMAVPAPMSSMRDTLEGWLGKIDPKTWKVVGMTPVMDPIWTEVSLDGKYAYTTSGAESRVFKINLETMKQEGEVLTGPGPWGAKLSYDGTKLYTADKGEGPGYNQLGRTSTIIDLQTMGVSKVVPIGTTTDHAILSPDGKEVWYTSNAEHAIYVMDTSKEEIVSVIKDPADGDTHGGVFVQYRDDGKGGVIGEVVADYAGLHGTALAAQMTYVKQPSLTIALNRDGFAQKSLSVPTGQATRLTIKNTAGTSGGKASIDAPALGITALTLAPGESQIVQWTAPVSPAELKASTNKTPNSTLTVAVKAPEAKQTDAGVSTGGAGPREVAITTKQNTWGALQGQRLTVKPGETLKFVVNNADDEKHNLIGLGDLGLLSPDIPAGKTATYEWTVPATASGTTQVICGYHPTMIFTLEIQK